MHKKCSSIQSGNHLLVVRSLSKQTEKLQLRTETEPSFDHTESKLNHSCNSPTLPPPHPKKPRQRAAACKLGYGTLDRRARASERDAKNAITTYRLHRGQQSGAGEIKVEVTATNPLRARERLCSVQGGELKPWLLTRASAAG